MLEEESTGSATKTCYKMLHEPVPAASTAWHQRVLRCGLCRDRSPGGIFLKPSCWRFQSSQHNRTAPSFLHSIPRMAKENTFEVTQEKPHFPTLEESTLQYWRDIDAFQESLRQSKGKPAYNFYDGPPFATGLPHYGHILAGTIKDVVTRYAHQRGYHVERRPVFASLQPSLFLSEFYDLRDFSVTGPKAGQLVSTTHIDCELVIPATQEVFTLPLQVCTKVEAWLKRCTYKRLQNSDQVRKRMSVHGIKSFKPPRHQYPHPYGIIGAGYNGIKTALYLLKDGQNDFTIFDRYDKVGGHAWLESANKTTRLQTEFATYHVWFGIATSQGAQSSTVPTDHDSLGEKLEHHKNATEAGYAGAFKPDNKRKPFVFTCSCYCIWPGNLINPRQVEYVGEDLFNGYIEYGVEMRCDYQNVVAKNVIIHGHGAFTMEIPGTKAGMLGDFDPWDMHSVSCNASRTNASVAQRTRFGIGDVYFLAAAYGLMEVVVDNIKRCSDKTVHLESGRKLEDADVILKCVGMLPDSTVDKVVHAKFMRGYWINGDPRRFSCADPDGIYASNFSGTTIGPGDMQ
eukprot:s206_g50.t1